MSHLSKLSLALAVASIASTASSGGLTETNTPTTSNSAASPPPTFTWKGFYVGGTIGRTKSKENGKPHCTNPTCTGTGQTGTGTGAFFFVLSSPNGTSPSKAKSGLSGSVFLGHNWVNGAFVYGVEGELRFSDKDIALGTNTLKRGISGNFRLRAGTAIDTTLLYGAAGIAASKIKMQNGSEQERKTITGWTIGAGVDHAFNQDWLARFEVSYTNYGTNSFSIDGGSNVKLKENRTSFGIAYRF